MLLRRETYVKWDTRPNHCTDVVKSIRTSYPTVSLNCGEVDLKHMTVGHMYFGTHLTERHTLPVSYHFTSFGRLPPKMSLHDSGLPRTQSREDLSTGGTIELCRSGQESFRVGASIDLFPSRNKESAVEPYEIWLNPPLREKMRSFSNTGTIAR